MFRVGHDVDIPSREWRNLTMRPRGPRAVERPLTGQTAARRPRRPDPGRAAGPAPAGPRGASPGQGRWGCRGRGRGRGGLVAFEEGEHAAQLRRAVVPLHQRRVNLLALRRHLLRRRRRARARPNLLVVWRGGGGGGGEGTSEGRDGSGDRSSESGWRVSDSDRNRGGQSSARRVLASSCRSQAGRSDA